MSGWRIADGDICSGLLRGVNRSISCRGFAHAFSCNVQPMGVVNEAIQDRVGKGGVADNFAPLLDRNLAGDDRRSALVAVFEDFKEIALFGLG